MPDSVHVFNQIIRETDLDPLVVLDLDSTLYNVSHRSQLILQHFINEHCDSDLFKEEIHQLKTIKIMPKDWGLKEAFIRQGLQASQEFFNTVRDYWHKHFFSSDFLHSDVPYVGAVDYVNALHSAGIRILYLTGRDAANMKSGTIESLKKWKFPISNVETDLLMKPSKGLIEDEEYKNNVIQSLKAQSPRIWFFENEPAIIQRVRQSSPEIQIVWIDTTHSRRSEPPQDLHVIRDIWRTK